MILIWYQNNTTFMFIEIFVCVAILCDCTYCYFVGFGDDYAACVEDAHPLSIKS